MMDQYHILGILAHANRQDKHSAYTLPPIETWSEEFCKQLNQLEYSEQLVFKLNPEQNTFIRDAGSVPDVFTFPSSLRIPKIKCCFYYPNLPVDFVRFHSTVILREDNEEIKQNCADSIQKNSGLWQNITRQLEALAKQHPPQEADEKNCALLTKACALNNHFSISTLSQDIDFDCWNELLQNVNDHIANDGELTIALQDTSLTLSYKERGSGHFTINDFIGICTNGNSGNVSNKNISSTGYKGTGFKSVYQLFETVTICSNNVRCYLDNTKIYDYSDCFKADNSFDISARKESQTDKKLLPVPEFQIVSTPYKQTSLTFTFCKDRFADIQNMIGLCTPDGQPQIIPNRYYFLEHIQTICYNGRGINLKEFLKDHFFFCEKIFEIPEDEISEDSLEKSNPLLKKSNRWKNLSKKDFIQMGNHKVQFLFPKQVSNDPIPLYCTLPIQTLSCLPFYVNCSAWELQMNRKDLNDQLAEWNVTIMSLVLADEGSCLQRAFSQFAEKYPDIAYQYFPYHFYYDWPCLSQIPFLQTTDCKESHLKSISQYYNSCEKQDDSFIILPDHLYTWFHTMGLDGYKSFAPFLYYPQNQKESLIREKLSNILSDSEHLEQKIKKIFIEFYHGQFYSTGVCNLYPEQKKRLAEDTLKQLIQVLRDSDQLDVYQWYLGKEICESQCHCLNNLEVEGWTPLQEYKDKCLRFFETINDDLFADCFPKLRKQLYYTKDTLVDPTDDFLNKIIAAYKEPSETFLEFSNELQSENDHEKKGALFEQGMVAVRLGNGSYRWSGPDLFISSRPIQEKFIVISPPWIRYSRLVTNLDYKMANADFYQEQSYSFLCGVLPFYKDFSDVASAIGNYLSQQERFAEKEIFLFEQLMDWGTGTPALRWDPKYLPLLKKFNKKYKERYLKKTTVHFQFEDSFSSELPNYIHQTLLDRLTQEEYEKCQSIIPSIRYSACCQGGYCLDDSAHQHLIVFAEQGLGQLLKDLLDIQAYLFPKQYTPMVSYPPLPLFRSYDNDLNLLVSLPQLPDVPDYHSWKRLLLERYEWKDENNVWHCSAGYGDPKQYQGCCPVCGAALIVEATALRIKYVRLCDTVHIPVLLCRNCAEAFSYSRDVYFCEDENSTTPLCAETAKNKLTEHGNMHLCFQLSGYPPKIYPLKLTLLHRKIAVTNLK